MTFLNQEITIFELKTWFAINIIMGVYNTTNIYSFFQNPTDFDPRGVDWIYHRMTQHRFRFMLSCIDYEIDVLAFHLAYYSSRATNISQIIAADETMSPSQAKNNPHHTYVPGKPCENGILCTSSGDQNGILLKLEPRRRLESDPQYLLAKTSADIKLNKSNLPRAPKTTMKALITDLTYEIPYAKNSCLVFDCLYAGLEVFENLSEKEYYGVGKCKSDRPSWLFKEYLHKILTAQEDLPLGAYAICKGTFTKTKKTFYAWTIFSKLEKESRTFINFISSYPPHFTTDLNVENIDVAIISKKDNSKSTIQTAIFNKDSIFDFYNSESGHIDRINSEITDSFPKYRMMRWKVPLLFTYFFGMLQNARKIQKKYDNSFNINNWRINTANVLSPQQEVPKEHFLERLFPKGGDQSQRKNCSVCSHFHFKKDNKTTFYCMACQVPICKKCYFDLEKHLNFLSSPKGKQNRFDAKFIKQI